MSTRREPLWEHEIQTFPESILLSNTSTVLQIPALPPIDYPTMSRQLAKKGFTLVEIMIVVVLIAVLAALSIPLFSNVNRTSTATVAMNDLRTFSESFLHYQLQESSWPSSHSTPGSLPPEMVGYLNQGAWEKTTPLGGYYAWHSPGDGNSVRIVLVSNELDRPTMQTIDFELDDGNLSTGVIRGNSNSLSYYLEPDKLP